jgi:hypothetical protein
MKKATAKAKAPVAEVKTGGRVAVSELNIGKAAARLGLSTKLVSTEIAYLQRTLGASVTQADLDANVLEVRRLPWASIALAD